MELVVGILPFYGYYKGCMICLYIIGMAFEDNDYWDDIIIGIYDV